MSDDESNIYYGEDKDAELEGEDRDREYGIVNPEAFILQNGTKTNPFVTFVNTQHLERNDGMYGCDMTYIQGIEFKNHSRKA
eukprot:11580444-Ditylum_brightwellii.AAC.1